VNTIEEAIFHAASELEDPQARVAFLERACADDSALRARIESLQEADARARQFMADDPLGLGPDHDLGSRPGNARPEEASGTLIGRYKLLQRIGEGGMGVVYMAEQEEPVRRRVALKIIKLGMDTRQVVARFEAERQALALMDHPNIARVLDGGATETGRPYFVMELVQGVPITEFCDKNHLSTEQRLKLFIPVCEAIQSAHQKGIIHRDLKPTNILVTLNPDGTGFPKVIDFGVAKATSQKLTEKTLFTAHGMMVGTPAYMSPEQAEMSRLDVDTRADIYSLGALLYELLTGSPPFPEQRLRSAGYNEMQRIILEEQPVKPSTRLSTLQKEHRSIVARNRGASELSLGRAFPTDLDWVVMKCLEKDRARRYETANGLAHDLERHLRNQPVTARPPSRLYELQKTVRRNWVGFAAVGAVVAVLAIGVVVSTFEAVRARRAERVAQRAQTSEAKQKSAAQQSLYNSLVAEARATRLARRVGYRDQVFALLKQARALDVPDRNLADLRREAVACLGDFVGLTPVDLTDFPTNIQTACLASSGQLAAFALADGTIHLREMPQNTEVARLGYTNGIVWGGLRFSSTDEQLFATFEPLMTNQMGVSPRICAWARDTTGAWRESENRDLPLAMKGLLCTEGGVLNVMIEFGYDPLIIESIFPRSPAETAHLQVGDEIVSFAGIPVSGRDRLEFSNLVEKCSGQVTPIIVERSSHRVELTVIPVVDPGSRRSLLGFSLHSSKGTFRLFNVETKAFVGCEVTQAWSPSNSMRFSVSGDGRWLAVDTGPREGPSSHVISLYDWKTGGLSNRLDVGGPGALSLSEDGRYLAWLAGDGRIYSVPDLKSIGYFSPADSRAVFSHNMAAVPIGQDNRLRIWNLPSREDVGVLEQPQNTRLLAFSSDGKALLACGARQARFYLLSTPEKLNLPGCSDGVSKVAFSPDGTRLASVYGGGRVRVSHAPTGQTLWETNNLPGAAHALNYSPDGKWLALGYWNNQLVSILDARTGQRLLELGTNGPGRTWSLQFSHDGHYFAAPTDSLGLRIWTIQPGGRDEVARRPDLTLVESWRGSTYWTKMGLEFAPDSRSLAYWSGDLWVWDFERSSQPRVVAPAMPAGEECLNFTPDGHTLLAMNTNHVIVAADVASGTQVLRHDANDVEPDGNALCLSPDGSKLAVNSAIRSAVNIRDPKSGKLLYALPAEPGWHLWFVWSPDSRRLAVCRDNGNVAIWNFETVEQVLAQLGLNQ
jgi:serine/threonine protein kinase/WD40 repeat protein